MDEDKTQDDGADVPVEEPAEAEQPEPKEETPPEETQTEQLEPDSAEPPEEAPEDTPQVPEEQPSRRESKRIKQLTEKLAQYESRQPQPQQAPPPVIGEGDYDVDEINQRAQQMSQQAYAQGLSQAQQMANAQAFATRLEIDTPKVYQKYDILDQNSDNFDPGRTAFINELYLRTVGYDPNSGAVANTNVRYEEFVDGIMEMVDTAAAAKSVDSKANLTKQAAQTGLRPSGTAKDYGGDDPSKMSTEQLKARIEEGLGIK